MGRPYSTDLRERVLRACENGEESQAVIARRFEISESAVGSWLRHLHKEGRRAPKPHGRGFRSILDEDDGAVLRSLVKDRNDATLKEYAQAQHLSVQAYCPEWGKGQAQAHELDNSPEAAGEPRVLAARHLSGLIG